ncbi:tRNA lysidine(34) synthetase TilS [Manganibacter manganicus]|uniref:tRNA(Ile)-lysidine synthase n=1 Tax=Manganibacter manganicus TaxID=1873176 RepID=A0A1V8RPM5_9HYPH|nr:tRNA lysidine(34) synthetase TilS [Pseudaminobacter manganicus]OQM75118.1 tRNA lysidine(34) synthetase TilS [Pseudaminobacter manganicus]
MLTIEAPPLSTLFDPIDFTGGVIAAVSGGSDSTALLILLKDYLDRNAPGTKLLAVTVDHGLRPGSDAEACAVARLCAWRGIDHRTLKWTGPKPATGLPAAARAARYRLLAQAAREAGIGTVLTGHTADDQAETVRMRMQRGGAAGAEQRGLAGMAPATCLEDGLWLLRPFLGARREALRDVLRREGVGWAEDPTNADRHYERPRVRAALDGAGAEALLELAHEAATERRSLDRRTARLLRRIATQPSAGLLRLSPELAQADDRGAAIHALRVLLATVGGVSFLPDKARVAALFERFAAAERIRATLSRVVVDARRGGLYLYREARGLPVPTGASDGMIWDGRRRITFRDRRGAMVIAPLGAHAVRSGAPVADDVPQSLVRRALAAEPVLTEQGENGVSAQALPLLAPWAHFLPDFDLETARVIAELTGAPPVPVPPFSGYGKSAMEPLH